jgi:peptidoglycan hydrolase-like protein with peptidoglycan-binding domain
VSIANIAPSSISAWRPLSNNQTEPRIKPRLLIYHTMVGGLLGTERYFKTVNGTGYSGTESTWGVGGPWDGPQLDGVAYQWQGTLFSADANFDPANNFANSIETSDGGIWKPTTPPWSVKQVAKLIQIGAWWCKSTGIDPTLARSYDGHGIGYHALFSQWNKANHACPGTHRIEQLREIIIPGIAKALDGHTDPPDPPVDHDGPSFPLPSGYYFGPASGGAHSISGLYSYKGALTPWQRQMRNRGWTLVADGVYGSQTADVVRSFQAEKHLGVDGLIGPATWKAAWTAKVT